MKTRRDAPACNRSIEMSV